MKKIAGKFWGIFSFILVRFPSLIEKIIQYSFKTPYWHLDDYMGRWWVFNPYDQKTHQGLYWWSPLSARIHHIQRADTDRNLHDHPWDARTIILKGWYIEERENGRFVRRAGDTTTLNYGEYHSIKSVSDGGVWTLFITFRYRGKWGFKVNGKKVVSDEYFKMQNNGSNH